MWYTYFLELSNNDIYVGFTGDLRKRLTLHQSAKITATSKYLPLKLKSYIAVDNKKQAMDLEKYFKTGSGKAVAKKRFL